MSSVVISVLDTKTLGLKMVPTLHDGIWYLEAFSDGIWYLEAFSGSDFVKDSRPDRKCSLGIIQKYGWSIKVAEMSRVVIFVFDTKILGPKMVPTLHDGIWYLEAFSDGIWYLEVFSGSDFVNDKEIRISVYGYVIYFCGVPIAWKSKSMRSVVLSTTEAEYVAISEVVKGIKFVHQILESMDVKVPLPIKVRVDNIGAIWLATNSGVSKRTNMWTQEPILYSPM